MNAVTPRAAGAIASLSSLKQGLANIAASIPVTTGDFYLRMEKDGHWVYGPENIEVEEGSRWAINPFSFKHGYVCWTNYPKPDRGPQPKNEKLGEVMVPMTAHKPGRETLEEYADPKTGQVWEWKDQTSCQLVCLNGTDKGEQVLYNVSSVGGSNEVSELVAAIMAQLEIDPDKPVPVIELACDHYPHKTYGKIYTPVLDIKDWVELSEGLPEVGEEAEEEVEQAKPEPAKPEPAKPAARQRKASPTTGKPTETAKPEGPKATEELAQAIETKEERRARLQAEMDALEEGEDNEGGFDDRAEQTRAATPAEIAAIKAAEKAAQQTSGATEVRRRRRVS